MVKWFLLGLMAFFAAEVAVFIAVGAAIGLLQALVLMLAASFLGLAILQHPGGVRISRMHEAVARDGLNGLQAGGDAFLSVAAGVLLIVPGFITDAAGLILLLPPVRAWIARRFERFMQGHTRRTPGVVDLEPDQWNRVPDRQIDGKREPNSPP